MHKNINTTHFILKDRGAGLKIVKTIGFSELREMMHTNSVTGKKDSDKTQFIPPEAMSGSTYTRSSDIWGLGIVLLMMANQGKCPFATEDQTDIQNSINAGEHLQVPAEFSANASYKSLLEHCLKIVPEERATIGSILHEILPDCVKKYIESDDFKEEFKLSRGPMILMNEEYKLFDAKLTEE